MFPTPSFRPIASFHQNHGTTHSFPPLDDLPAALYTMSSVFVIEVMRSIVVSLQAEDVFGINLSPPSHLPFLKLHVGVSSHNIDTENFIVRVLP